MPTWPLLTRRTAPEGIPQFAQVKPNQAFSQLGMMADQAASVYDQAAQKDAAINGAQALADFHIKMSGRQQELRTKATTPDGFTIAAASDFDQQAQELLDATPDHRVQDYLDQRLIAAREAHVTEAQAWEAATKVDLRAAKVTDTLDKLANVANTSPGRFGQVLGDFNSMLEAAGLPLDAVAKLRVTGKQTIARSAVQGQLETNPHGILKELTAGKWDDYLDAGAKAGLVNSAQAEVKRQAAQAKAEAAQNQMLARVEAQYTIQSDLVSRRETGTPVVDGKNGPTMAQLKAIMKPAEFERYQHDAQLSDKLWTATNAFPTSTLEQMQKQVDTLKPVPGTETYATDQAVYAAALQKMQQAVTQRQTNPVAAVAYTPAVVKARAALQAAKTPEQQLAANNALVEVTLAAQREVGVARPRILAEAQAKEYVAGIMDPNAPNRGTQMLQGVEGLRAKYGKRWPQVLTELRQAGLPSEAQGFHLFDQDKVLVNKLAAGISQGPALKKAIDPQALKTLDTSVANYMQQFNQTATAERAAETTSMIKTMALVDVANGIDPDTAARTAAAALADRYHYRDKYRIPKVRDLPTGGVTRVDDEAIKQAGRHVINSLRPLDVVDYRTGAHQSDADARERYVDSIQVAGRWKTLSGDVGLTLVDAYGNQVLRPDGKPVSMSWAQAEKIGAPYKPAPNAKREPLKRYPYPTTPQPLPTFEGN